MVVLLAVTNVEQSSTRTRFGKTISPCRVNSLCSLATSWDSDRYEYFSPPPGFGWVFLMYGTAIITACIASHSDGWRLLSASVIGFSSSASSSLGVALMSGSGVWWWLSSSAMNLPFR